MKEMTLKLTDEEFDLLESLRRRKPSGCVVCEGTSHGEEGQHVLMVDDVGGMVLAECEFTEGSAEWIAAALNGLLRKA